MDKFYSVEVGNKLKFKGCSCGYGLQLGEEVECIKVVLDKFFWINPNTGEKRMTKMGSPCFELVKEEKPKTKRGRKSKQVKEEGDK